LRLSLVTLLLLAPALRADGLADLRAALQKLPATQSVHATAQVNLWSRNGKGKSAKITQGQAHLRLQETPSGLGLEWDQAELHRIQAASDAKDQGPKRAMGTLDAEKATALLDAAKSLLQGLKNASLQQDRADTWQGHPARLLVFTVDDLKDMTESDRKHLKSYTRTVNVWMGADGVPLAAKSQMDLKGSFFLISFESHTEASRTYTRVGDRLVATHEETLDSGSGAGESSESKTVTDLKL